MAGEEVNHTKPRQYRLTYRIRSPDGCLIRDTDGPVSDVSVAFDGSKWLCELLVHDDEGALSFEHSARSAMEPCACSVVIDHGAVPHLQPAPSSGAIDITIYVDETTDAQALTEDLDAVATKAELVDYAELGSGSGVTVSLDLGALTAKRRAALRRAITHEYFDTPSQTTIEEMAEDAGISSSAFATRLRKAEREVFEQISRIL